ncbi:RNA polymerase II largest subunit, partial [Tanacetum coccineum]
MELLLTLSLNSLSCCSSMLLLNELLGQPRAQCQRGEDQRQPDGEECCFLARTFITPYPTINIDQLGVPWSIALNLTYPKTVTPYIIERLKELVDYNPHPLL